MLILPQLGGKCLKLFSARKESGSPAVQTCTAADRGSILPSLYQSANPAQYRLCRELRKAVPVIDAAIGKLIRLMGDYRFVCADETAQKALDSFAQNVRVGGVGTGLKQFILSYFDQLLTYGTAVGEIVPTADGSGIAALYNAPVDAVELKTGSNPLDVRICAKGYGISHEVEHPELICISLLNPDPGTLKGNSILNGLPFVSEILLKIFDSVGQNFERAGNVRFAVTYRPPAGTSAMNSKQRVEEIAAEWSRAMRDKGRVCDFISVGDVSVKAIGADNQILDCDVPVRHILEQIVAKLSIPPFLLGLSWSTTERMSSQQADILTSELDYYRSLLTPVLLKIARIYLNFAGLNPQVELEWDNISLQDETELATARLDNARAAQIEATLTEVKE